MATVGVRGTVLFTARIEGPPALVKSGAVQLPTVCT